jgi:hypothetical protein
VTCRGDHDRHAAVLDSGEKILADLLGEFLLVPVKHDGIVRGGPAAMMSG